MRTATQLAADATYRARNRERIASQDKAYRDSHRAELNARSAAYHAAHREARNAARRANREADPEQSRAWARKHKYGLTATQFAELSESQGHACATCGRQVPLLNVDHDHETGRVRGLLCSRCNRALGIVNDNPQILLNLVAYLAQQTGPQCPATALPSAGSTPNGGLFT